MHRIVRVGLFSIGILLLLLHGSSSRAQESPAQRHAMATNALKRVALEMSERSLREVTTLQDWNTRRPVLRRQLLDMLGLDPLPRRTPMRPRVTGHLQRENYRIEKIVFQSMPGLYVTGNFYVPNGAAGPLPAILYLCGHAPHPRGAKVHYQDRAQWFASNGFACFIIDTLEFGEVPGIHHGTHDLNMWHWLSLGYTPAGVEVWNAMRALDYLETRPEVDPRKIGLTGISGGGAITWYTAAVDERVAAAAPVCSTITYGSQAANWRAAGQCDCIYYHNTYALDFPVVAALIAPRPLLMINGRKDADFPPDGYRQVYARAQRIFDLQGALEQIGEFDAEVGHTDAPEFLQAARQWMQRWLQKTTPPYDPRTPPAEPAEALACLSALPADATNYRIHNEFTRPAQPKASYSRRSWDKRRAELIAALNEKVFRWFPANPLPFETKAGRNDGGWATRYASYKEVSFQSEEGARVRAQLFTPTNSTATTPVLIYAKRPGDSIYFMDLDELLPILGRWTVLILHPRFTEVPISAAEYRNIAMTAAWTGRTIPSMQIWDMLRAIEWLHKEETVKPATLSIYAKGEMAAAALYAALLDPRVTRTILNDPPASHWNGSPLLNILRVTDLAEVAGALAPRTLVTLRPPPASWSLTKKLYQLNRASAQYQHTASLPEALRIWENTLHKE